MVGLGLVGRHRDGGPAVEPDGGQRLGRRVAQVADLEGRRRFGALRAHQRGLVAGVRAQPRDRQRGGIAAQHHQLRHRLEGAAERALPRRRRALRRIADATVPIADPLGRRARVPQRQQPRDRGVVRRDPLDQDIDACAAEQADVRPGAAGAVDEPARLAVGQAGLGVAGDVGLEAAAGEEAGEDAYADHHLGADRPRAAAIEPDDGGERARPVGRARRFQRRPRVVAEAEHRPVGQHLAHPRTNVTLALNLPSTAPIRLLKGSACTIASMCIKRKDGGRLR